MKFPLAVILLTGGGAWGFTTTPTFGRNPDRWENLVTRAQRPDDSLWDNDDFLSALSGKNPVNPGDASPPPSPPPREPSRDDPSGGGSRFRQMMEMAEKAKSSGRGSRAFQGVEVPDFDFDASPPPPAPPQQQQQNPANPQQPPAYDPYQQQQYPNQPPPNYQGQPPPAQQYAPPPPQYYDQDPQQRPPPRKKAKIANTSDLYLEQLKIDTKARLGARMSGDVDSANKPWEDPRIHELKFRVNPFLEKQKNDEAEMISAIEEEMVIGSAFDEKEERPANFSGISYREKMKLLKQKKAGKQPVEQQQEQPAEPVKQRQQQLEEPPVVENVIAPSPEPVTPPPPPPQVAETAPPKEISPPEPAAPASSDVVSAADMSPEEYDEFTRPKLRTLMGLLLKHRGGPGFGAGRLKMQAEIDRYQNTMEEVLSLLKEESGVTDKDVEKATAAQQKPSPPPPVVASVAPAATAKMAALGVTAPTPASKSPTSSPVDVSLKCVIGTIQIYEEAQQADKLDALETLRGTLQHAVNMCKEELSKSQSTTAVVDAAASVASPPPPPATSAWGFPPDDGYAVTKLEEKEEETPAPSTTATKEEESPAPSATVTTSSSDHPENDQALGEILAQLENNRGDAKFGLKESLTSGEANDLADKLVDMRSILLDELGMDKPAPPPAPVASAPVAPAPVEENLVDKPRSFHISEQSIKLGYEGGMKYQAMLEKAKAEKARKNAS